MQLKPICFQVLYEPFLAVRILSTFSMFFQVPIRTEKCNAALFCNLFGVILHIDSTNCLAAGSLYRIGFGERYWIESLDSQT